MTCQLEADSAPPLDLLLEKSGAEWVIKSPASTAKKEGAITVLFAGEGYTWTATGI